MPCRDAKAALPLLGGPALTSRSTPATHEATVNGQEPVQLSNREFAFLHALMARAEPFSRAPSLKNARTEACLAVSPRAKSSADFENYERAS